MTRFANLALVAVLAGCAASQPPAAPERMPEPLPVIVPRNQAVIKVSQLYYAAVQAELPKILSPKVTADYVVKVHLADLEARRALLRLERQGRAYTPAALASAREAVARLSHILEDSP